MEAFRKIFTGLMRAHGCTYVDKKGADGLKVKGKSFVKREIVTDKHWEDHLNGIEPSLGIIPINEDNECRWGCIDVDKYTLDHKQIIIKVEQLGVPLSICRSKSGGAHLYLFTKQYVSAKDMQTKLSEMATAIGYPKAEVFPKQIELYQREGEEKRDTGSWINLPYHGRSRYGLSDLGDALSLEEFLSCYDNLVVGALKSIKTDFKNEVIKDGPPCLQILTEQGVSDGSRNNALFNVGVYYRKADPDSFKELIEDYNRSYISPPLKSDEVLIVIKQVSQSDGNGAPKYMYRCTQPPIESLCNKRLCKKRKFGVGSEGDRDHPVYSDLKVYKSDPPRYFLNVDDRRIEIGNTEDLMTHKKIIQACLEQLNTGIMNMSSAEWNQTYSNLFESISIDYPPEEVTKKGEFKELLEEFCLHQGEALTIADIFLGKFKASSNLTMYTHPHSNTAPFDKLNSCIAI